MDLRQLRAEAWLLVKQVRGCSSLFFIPIIVPIALGFYTRTRPEEVDAPMLLTIPQIIVNAIQRNLFPQILNFILSIFVLSATFTLIDILRKKRSVVIFSDSLRAFSSQIFTQVFLTLLCKRLLLFCWGSLVWIGSALSLFSSYRVLDIYTKAGTAQLSEETAQQIINYSPAMLLGLLLIILGLVIALPQYYAYSQAEYILYDQLNEGTYKGALHALHQSRVMMRGYKDQRFLLDLSLLGWHLLVFISFGIAGIYVTPYIHTTSVLFYEKLKNLHNEKHI